MLKDRASRERLPTSIGWPPAAFRAKLASSQSNLRGALGVRLFTFERVFEAADGVLDCPPSCPPCPPTPAWKSLIALPTTCLTAPLICFRDPTIRSFP